MTTGLFHDLFHDLFHGYFLGLCYSSIIINQTFIMRLLLSKIRT